MSSRKTARSIKSEDSADSHHASHRKKARSARAGSTVSDSAESSPPVTSKTGASGGSRKPLKARGTTSKSVAVDSSGSEPAGGPSRETALPVGESVRFKYS
jgi:hypothetical protein